MYNTYDYSELYGKIRSAGLTQEDLAQKANIGVVSLNKSLTNKRSFKQDEISNICRVLKIPIEDIDRYFFAKKLAI